MEAAAIQPDLTEAFPESLRSHVREVLGVVPTSAQRRSPNDNAAITLYGKPLRIPARIYHPEPDWRAITAVVLYFTGVMGNPPHTQRAWKVLINPHAANQLPAQLLEALTKLPTALQAA